eukprot:comp5946_c0_seq1/m.1800 comp5946_c0_seq1/g.1800  ORF comp5946_c0_seq1/g.1800 comp5946_c0_seq1/m.1800 type:complete len:282 (-) comp5946_c0_seq1:142-987(-)
MEPDPDKVSPFWLHKDVSIDFAEQPMIFEALAVSDSIDALRFDPTAKIHLNVDDSAPPSRPIVLRRLGDQRFGFSVQKVGEAMCVSLVLPGSMAESAGLVVGDHILMCNGMQLRYATTDSMLTDLASLPTIDMLVADCSFDVTVSVVRTQGQPLGLNLENGKIVSVTEGSLCAQYPIPLDHYLVEVNHDCVIGIHGPRLQRIIQQAGNVVSLRMMPAAEFELLLQRVGGSAAVRQVMDNYLLQLGRLEVEGEVEEPIAKQEEESPPPQPANEPSLFKRLFW